MYEKELCQARKLSALWTEVVEKDTHFLYLDKPAVVFPNMDSNLNNWKVADKPKTKIDMSIITANFLCEFKDECDSTWRVINYLKEVRKKGVFIDKNNNTWEKCRFLQDYWYAWKGAKCSLPEGLMIVIRWSDSSYSGIINDYKDIDWNRVIAFKVIGTANNSMY